MRRLVVLFLMLFHTLIFFGQTSENDLTILVKKKMKYLPPKSSVVCVNIPGPCVRLDKPYTGIVTCEVSSYVKGNLITHNHSSVLENDSIFPVRVIGLGKYFVEKIKIVQADGRRISLPAKTFTYQIEDPLQKQ